MSLLSWISDEDLLACVKTLADSAQRGAQKAQKNLSRNVLDPFSILFNTCLFERSHEEWQREEILRQQEKALSNALGLFHQKVCASVIGWEDPGAKQTFDLICPERKILAEMKNKYNTLNARGQSDVYKKLSGLVIPKSSLYFGYTAYLVQMITKPSMVGDHLYAPSDNDAGQKHPSHENIRCIDGRSFYALVTGVEDALDQLLQTIPAALERLGVPKVDAATWEFVYKTYCEAYGL